LKLIESKQSMTTFSRRISLFLAETSSHFETRWRPCDSKSCLLVVRCLINIAIDIPTFLLRIGVETEFHHHPQSQDHVRCSEVRIRWLTVLFLRSFSTAATKHRGEELSGGSGVNPNDGTTSGAPTGDGEAASHAAAVSAKVWTTAIHDSVILEQGRCIGIQQPLGLATVEI
jgi:hypothetical protein